MYINVCDMAPTYGTKSERESSCITLAKPISRERVENLRELETEKRKEKRRKDGEKYCTV